METTTKAPKTTQPIYNGLSIREILKNLPHTFSKSDRNFYVKNCIEFYKNDSKKINQGYNECIKTTNFDIIKNHLLINNAIEKINFKIDLFVNSGFYSLAEFYQNAKKDFYLIGYTRTARKIKNLKSKKYDPYFGDEINFLNNLLNN